MLDLIIWFFKIGAFSFGGGLATLPNIYEMANVTKWLTEKEVTDLISLSQMTPGPLATNIASFVGNRNHGLPGAILAVIAFVVPSIVFMSVFYKFLKKVQKSKTFEIVMSTVRAAGFATVIEGSYIILKNAIFNNPEVMEWKNFLQFINIKAVLIVTILFFIITNKKISAIMTLGLGGLLGIIFMV